MIKVRYAFNETDYKDFVIKGSLSVQELMDKFKITESNIGAILVDGRPAKLTDKISEGSEVYFLPLISGG